MDLQGKKLMIVNKVLFDLLYRSNNRAFVFAVNL